MRTAHVRKRSRHEHITDSWHAAWHGQYGVQYSVLDTVPNAVMSGQNGHADTMDMREIQRLIVDGAVGDECEPTISRVAEYLRRTNIKVGVAYQICDQIAAACRPPFRRMHITVDTAYGINGYGQAAQTVEDDTDTLVLRAPIPVFPTASLPIELRNYASASSLPVAALASAGLSALAVAIGGETELQVTDETTVRAIVWNVPIGMPSAGKSPAGVKLFGPLRERDAEKAAQHAVELEAWLAEDKHNGPRPVEEILVHGSLTVEALFDVLQDTPSMGQWFDELSHFMNDLGRYHKGQSGAVGADSGDAAMYLEGWTGAPMRARRIGQRVRGRASVKLYCAKPTISLWGPLTIANQGLLGGEGSGFRCRWLPYLVQARTDLPKGKIFDPGDVDHAEYTAAWKTLINRLLDRRTTPRRWYLPDDARQRVEFHRARWHQRAEAVESSMSVTAACGKADVAMESIALILAEAERVELSRQVGRIGVQHSLPISVEVMDRAAAWVDYCVDTWAALGDAEIVSFTMVDRLADPVVTRVEEWIAQHGLKNDPIDPWVWEDDLYTHKVGGVRERRDWKPVLARYQGRNPGHIVVVDMPGKRGPKPRRVYAPRYRQVRSENVGS